ncbi:hypothetical protein Tco_0194149 [Tanacetum coccineum]
MPLGYKSATVSMDGAASPSTLVITTSIEIHHYHHSITLDINLFVPPSRSYHSRKRSRIALIVTYSSHYHHLPLPTVVPTPPKHIEVWDHGGSSLAKQQTKIHKVIRAHTAEPSNKKGYAGNLPLCNKCKFYHTGPCAENVAIASGLVIKLEIVGPQSRERNRGPQWQNRKLKLPVMSVEG